MPYIGNTPGFSTARIVTSFTATAGQTSFSPSGGYIVNYVDVYYNGVRLVAGDDFTATDGSSIVLTVAASAGDSVEVVSYIPRGLSDGYTKAEADAKYALLGANTDITSLTPDYITFDQTAVVTDAVGRLTWDSAIGSLRMPMIGGNAVASLGQTMHAYVTNAESFTINKGQPVYLYQAQGDRATVKLAANTSDATSAKTLGLAAENIGANQTGYVICQGVISNVDTSAFSPGVTLYLGSTAGSLTSTKPVAPNHLVYIGVVEKANAGGGQIYVRPQNGYELDEIHDVLITSPANGQVLTYDGTTSLWKNQAPTSSFTTLSASGNFTLSGGTANGVLYLNGSKVATSGSALMFDGTNLALAGGNAATQKINIYATGSTAQYLAAGNSNTGLNGTLFGVDGTGNAVINNTQAFGIIFSTSSTEQMRLTSTGLGIGTSSPTAKLHVKDATGTAVTLLNLESAYSNPSGNKSILWTDATSALGRISISYNTSTGSTMSFGSLYNGGYQTSDLMVLTSAGSLGIGTTTPLRKLDISGGGMAFTESGGAARNIHWGDTTNIYPVMIGGNATSGNCFFTINTNTFGNAAVERFRIGPAGEIGLSGANYGTSGQVLTSNGAGAAPTWQTAGGGTPTLSVTSSTSFTAAANTHYVLVGGATTVTLPASPAAGAVVWITVGNGRTDNVIARNGQNINSLAENMTIDNAYAGIQLRYADATRGWIFT